MLPGKPQYQRPPPCAQARVGLSQVGFTRTRRQMQLAPLVGLGQMRDESARPHDNRLVAVLHAGHLHRLQARTRLMAVPHLGVALAPLARRLVVSAPLLRCLTLDRHRLINLRATVGGQSNLPDARSAVGRGGQNRGARQRGSPPSHTQNHHPLVLTGQLVEAGKLRRAIEIEVETRDIGDGVVENGQRSRLAVHQAGPARSQQDQFGLDALFAQQGHQQQGLVLAVAKPAQQHLAGGIGLVAVDAKLESHVARLLDHEPMQRPHFLSVAVQPRCDFGRHLFDGWVTPQLVHHQAPVPAAHFLPALVGADVQVGRDLGEPGHRGLDVDACHIGSRPAIDHLILLALHLTLESGQAGLVEGELPLCRRDERVVPVPLGQHVANDRELAEIVGHVVLVGDIGDGVLHLDHVAGAQVLEGHHLGTRVVVQAVPGFGKVAVVSPARPGRLDLPGSGAAKNARLADLHVLLAGHVAHQHLLAVARRTLGAQVNDALNEHIGETVWVYPCDVAVEQNHRRIAVRCCRRRKQCRPAHHRAVSRKASRQILDASRPTHPIRGHGQRLGVAPQRRLLRSQAQRSAQASRRLLHTPHSRQQATQLFVQAGLVGQAQQGPSQHRLGLGTPSHSLKHTRLLNAQKMEVGPPLRRVTVEPGRLALIAAPVRSPGQVSQQVRLGATRVP